MKTQLKSYMVNKRTNKKLQTIFTHNCSVHNTKVVIYFKEICLLIARLINQLLALKL